MRAHKPTTTLTSRVGALVGAACVTLGVVLLPWAAQPAAASATLTASLGASPPSPTASPSASKSPSHTHPKAKPVRPPRAPRGGAVVRGIRMYDPATGKRFSHYSYVTVSQVSNLTNQVVQVNWQGFTPSDNVPYDPDSTDYPVMVAECAGTDPTSPNQCFGANNDGVAATNSQYGPMTTSYGVTAANGTGETPIELLTALQDQQLGCDIGKPCSLVIVPSQGGNTLVSPPQCNDHTSDTGLTDTGSFAFTSLYGSCSWNDRIIVPLYFARTQADCPVRSPDFSAIGSPMLARAMASWQSGLCSGSDAVTIQYDSAQSEPLAREDFQAGDDDVALTTMPASGASKYPYTYAPVAISAESVAYWIDNPVTLKPLTNIKLDPRLVLKLLTQSYNFENEGCGHGVIPTKGVGCDNAVDGDPESLFADPEFQQLNPHVAAVGDGYQVPTVLSGESDMTWVLTSWIAANKAAKSFADGAFDPWGEHVNTDYLDMALPTLSLNAMDPYPPVAHLYSPTYPLSQVATYQVDNWSPGTEWQPDNYGNYDAVLPEIPGNRALFAILDQADAVSYELPVAALENADGQYVKPTDASMTAAVNAMTTAKNGITQSLIQSKKVSGAYPLTMVIYAMVPTGGVSKQTATKIGQWLDYVAGQGQTTGNQPGDLPPGYLPLTAAMRAQTLKAATEVLDQVGNKAKGSTAGKSKSSVKASATATATATPTPSPTATHGTVSLGYATNPPTSGLARYALPALLIAGGALAVAGAFALVVGRNGAVALVWLRRRTGRQPVPKQVSKPVPKGSLSRRLLPRRNKP
jgi:PBP superfamily domain